MSRFFLAMNGKVVNTLDDLHANFNGSQMLAFFRSGRLQKWLAEQGESKLLETVKEFESENYDDDTLLSMLMAVFELSDESIAKQIAERQKEQKENIEKTVATESKNAPEVANIEPEIKYSPEERNILKIRDKFLWIMRKVLADDMQDYENFLDISFQDFGIKESVRKQLILSLAKEFQFSPSYTNIYVPAEYNILKKYKSIKYVDETPIKLLCSLLSAFGPECFSNSSYPKICECGYKGLYCPIKYYDLILTGKIIPPPITTDSIDYWAEKANYLKEKAGQLAFDLRPKSTYYNESSASKYHRQKAVLALLDDHFSNLFRKEVLDIDSFIYFKQSGQNSWATKEKIISLNSRLITLFHPPIPSIPKAQEKGFFARIFTRNTPPQTIEKTFFRIDPDDNKIQPIRLKDVFEFCNCL